MANTLVNLQQSLAQVEAKLNKLNHYREYLLTRIGDLSRSSTSIGDVRDGASRFNRDHCGSWALVMTIRVADGMLAASALADPTVKVLQPTLLNRDLANFKSNCNSIDADKSFECWATLFSWLRVACERDDGSLQTQVIRALTLSGISSDDERIAHFEQFVRTFNLEDSAKALPATGIMD